MNSPHSTLVPRGSTQVPSTEILTNVGISSRTSSTCHPQAIITSQSQDNRRKVYLQRWTTHSHSLRSQLRIRHHRKDQLDRSQTNVWMSVTERLERSRRHRDRNLSPRRQRRTHFARRSSINSTQQSWQTLGTPKGNPSHCRNGYWFWGRH
jgi:hypothetical protein